MNTPWIIPIPMRFSYMFHSQSMNDPLTYYIPIIPHCHCGKNWGSGRHNDWPSSVPHWSLCQMVQAPWLAMDPILRSWVAIGVVGVFWIWSESFRVLTYKFNKSQITDVIIFHWRFLLVDQSFGALLAIPPMLSNTVSWNNNCSHWLLVPSK